MGHDGVTGSAGGPIGHMGGEEFQRLAGELASFVAGYLDRVESMHVGPGVEPGEIASMLPEHAPEQGEGWDAIIGDLERVVLPGLTHWQSPRFFGYFPANTSYPALLGDLVSGGVGVQGMLWQTSPACTEIETRVMDWLGGLIGLPETFLARSGTGGGVILGTASEATLTALVAARHRVRAAVGERTRGNMTVYASREAHSSVMKSAIIAGLADGPEDLSRVRLIETDAQGAMRTDALERAMREDVESGLVPMFVCATVGTTGTHGVDRLGEVSRVVERARGGAPVWIHVDAAHAGAALVCDEHRWMIDGVHGCDSLCFNPHKWLLVNFDCDAFWVRDRESLVGGLSITPEYLRNPASEAGNVIDYRDWQVPLGRRFRALKLWFVLRHYGAQRLRAYIREHCRIAEVFEHLVRADARFELPVARVLNLVLFRLAHQDPTRRDQLNLELKDRLNSRGRIFLTHTHLPGSRGAEPGGVVLRLAVGATQTQERHVREAWDEIAEVADGVCPA